MYKTFTAGPVGGPELEGRLPDTDSRDLLLGAGLFESQDLAQIQTIEPDLLAWMLKDREPSLQPAEQFGVVQRIGQQREVAPVEAGQFVLVALRKTT